jgi:hypothetical protein
LILLFIFLSHCLISLILMCSIWQTGKHAHVNTSVTRKKCKIVFSKYLKKKAIVLITLNTWNVTNERIIGKSQSIQQARIHTLSLTRIGLSNVTRTKCVVHELLITINTPQIALSANVNHITSTCSCVLRIIFCCQGTAPAELLKYSLRYSRCLFASVVARFGPQARSSGRNLAIVWHSEDLQWLWWNTVCSREKDECVPAQIHAKTRIGTLWEP